MRRYLRSLSRFWAAAVAAEAEYRVNFTIAIIASAGNLGGSIFVLSTMFLALADPPASSSAPPSATPSTLTAPSAPRSAPLTPDAPPSASPPASPTASPPAKRASGPKELNGWTWEQALLVIGVFALLEGLAESLMVPNLSRIVQHVTSGTLDFVLLKPIDSQFWVSTRNVSLWGLPTAAFGVAILVYGAWRQGLGGWDLARAIPALLAGAAILYSLWFMLGATSIWFVKTPNVVEVLRSLLEAGKYPTAAYPPAYRFFFTFVVPVSFITTVPAEVMLGRLGLGPVLRAMAVALGLVLLSRAWWRFALRHYTSASS